MGLATGYISGYVYSQNNNTLTILNSSVTMAQATINVIATTPNPVIGNVWGSSGSGIYGFGYTMTAKSTLTLTNLTILTKTFVGAGSGIFGMWDSITATVPTSMTAITLTNFTWTITAASVTNNTNCSLIANLLYNSSFTVHNMSFTSNIAKGNASAPFIFVNQSTINIDNLSLIITITTANMTAGLILLANSSTVTVSKMNSSLTFS